MRDGGPIASLAQHWREYLIEAAGLGLFMVSACVFVALIEYPGSPVPRLIEGDVTRRLLIGLAMGLTAISIIYSPWGKQSGAHLNPAVTLTFWRLGKVEPWDAVFYVLAQFAGGVAGVLVSAVLLGHTLISHPSINYVVTTPGDGGAVIAFVAEVAISFGMMLMVLVVSNRPAINRYTGLFAGALVATYITLEAPVSGMSMNPARSFGSAFSADLWSAIWVYFSAPLLGMLTAAEVYVRSQGAKAVLCCKLHHENDRRCIFRCGYRRHAQAGAMAVPQVHS